MNYDIDELSFMIHSNAVDKGFWEPLERMQDEDKILFYLKQVAMIHSECSEVLEAMRKEKGDDLVVEELADIIIRTFDLWAGLVRDGYTKQSLKEAVFSKMEKNSTRQRLHGVLG